MKTTLAGLILMALCATSVADENTPYKMPVIAKWVGPFSGTTITKYADYSEGVACYVYAPDNVGMDASSFPMHFVGSIGSISCVKVMASPSKKK